jgi:hypothetical protein
MFLNCSTCFGRHTANHQELKNCNCSLWELSPISHRSGRQPKTYVKPEAVITVFELLMMGGVSPETCWEIKKHWNNTFYYMVAFCWFFLWDLKTHHLMLFSEIISVYFKDYTKRTNKHVMPETNCSSSSCPLLLLGCRRSHCATSFRMAERKF